MALALKRTMRAWNLKTGLGKQVGGLLVFSGPSFLTLDALVCHCALYPAQEQMNSCCVRSQSCRNTKVKDVALALSQPSDALLRTVDTMITSANGLAFASPLLQICVCMFTFCKSIQGAVI